MRTNFLAQGLVILLDICGFSKTWAQAISPNGAKTSLGLGSYPVVTLAMARDRALANARAIAEGRDPRRRMQKVLTFAQANETVVAIHARHWKSKRTEGQWRASMRDYVLPRLARKRVDAVTTADVMAVLLPIWSTKRVTAGRVRQRIGAVMKWAVAQGYRDDNPAGDVLSAALAPQSAREPHPSRRAPMSWMQRLKRVFHVDIEHCGMCGGTLRVIACIETPLEVPLATRARSLIEKILTHLAARETGGINHPRAPPLHAPLTQPPACLSPALS